MPSSGQISYCWHSAHSNLAAKPQFLVKSAGQLFIFLGFFWGGGSQFRLLVYYNVGDLRAEL